ncbi:MAG: Hpt domain-containing protein, partial [Spirochaetes bacterium]|nr:Hpt domain-containing protein [Spirochaetota bacterium]
MGFEAQSELFIEESLDLLKNIELPLMELEERPDDSELINSVFRSMHTIKGSAGMFGFNDISAFTHDIESTFDLVRKGELALTSEIIDLTLKAKDCIRELLYKNDSDEERDKRGMILIRFAEITGGSKKSEVSPVSVPSKEEAEEKSFQPDAEKHDELPGESAAFNVRFAPQKEILLRGVRIPPLFDELATLGKTEVKADISSVPELNDFDPEHCYLSWDINIETDKTEADIRSVFI